jgi:hypothetical protein
MMFGRIAALAAAVCLQAVSATAQPVAPVQVRGSIETLAGDVLEVRTREGPEVAVTIPASLSIRSLRRIGFADIQPNSYVGAAARPGPDGELQAIEVHVFPDSERGRGEGHFDWALEPGSTMTNATVMAIVRGASGRTLRVRFMGLTASIRVPEDAPIVEAIPAERSDLKPGAPVFVMVRKDEGGQLTAIGVVVGKNGVAPPM